MTTPDDAREALARLARAYEMCREVRRRSPNNWCHAICQMLHFGTAHECEDALATYGEHATAALSAQQGEGQEP